MRMISEKTSKINALNNVKPKAVSAAATPTNKKKSKVEVQNYHTYEEGKLICPMRINMEALPKFFK